jgi:branched-chain amino acid transport system substrate-binding protein
MDAAKGDVNAKDPLYAAIRGAKLNSPRGPMTMSAANNPIQNIYLREVKNGKNAYVKIAAEALSDPAPAARWCESLPACGGCRAASRGG